jgi:hypothetical protein
MATALKYGEGDYTYWHKALAGDRPAMNEGNPHAGFYRMRNKQGPDDAVSYFWNGSELVCVRNGTKKVDPNSIWTYCGHNAVSHDDYLHRIKMGRWPNDAEVVAKSNLPPDDNSKEAVLARLDALESEAKQLIKAGAAQDQNTADRASDIANSLGEIEKRVIGLHKVEKQPHLDAGRAVDTKWFPVRDLAATIKASLKSVVVTPFLVQLRRAADAEKEKAKELGVEQYLDQPSIGAGSLKRTTALRTKVSAKIVDYDVLIMAIKDSSEVRDLAQRLADASCRATGIALPGTVKIETETAA